MEMIKRVFNGEIKGIDEKEGTLTAYVSTNAIDRYKEVLDPNGVDLKNYKNNPVVLWAHDYSQPPIGKALWIKKDERGLVSKVKFASTQFAQEIFQLYKEGMMKAFSVGFIPTETEEAKSDDRENPKKPRRTYKKWELLEYSAVPVPANPEALSLALQRGIISGELKKQFDNQSNEQDINDICEEIEIEPKKEIAEDISEKEPEYVLKFNKSEETGLEDIIAENELLKAQLSDMGKELNLLRYEAYKLSMQTSKAISEITVKEFESKALEVLDGVIRKAMGKVN